MYTRQKFTKTVKDFKTPEEFEAALAAHEKAEDEAEAAANGINANQSAAAANTGASGDLQLVRGVFTVERNAAGAREIVFTGKLADGTDFVINRLPKTENSPTMSAVRKALMKSPSQEADIYVQLPNQFTPNFRFMSVSADSLQFDFGLDEDQRTDMLRKVKELTAAGLDGEATRQEYRAVRRERQARFA